MIKLMLQNCYHRGVVRGISRGAESTREESATRRPPSKKKKKGQKWGVFTDFPTLGCIMTHCNLPTLLKRCMSC